MSDEKTPRLLASGWWFCLCDRGCGCARAQRLNPPTVVSCARCGGAVPEQVTDHRVRPRPRPPVD